MEEKAFLAPNTVSNDDSTEKSASEDISNSLAPSVKLFDPVSNVQTARKPTIGGRTAQSKRPSGVSLCIYDKTIIYTTNRSYLCFFNLILVGKESWEFRSSKSQDQF